MEEALNLKHIIGIFRLNFSKAYIDVLRSVVAFETSTATENFT